MEMKENESGILVPVEKPKKKLNEFGVLEILDDAKRELAKKALSDLWDAMELSKNGSIRFPNTDRKKEWRRMFDLVAPALLGEDAPYKEELC
jgi:hypothetical protein